MTRVYVSTIVQNKDGEILILKRVDSARFAPGQWEFVNGTIEGKDSAEDTALRELKEETGLTANIEELVALPVHELDDSDGHWVAIPFWLKSNGPITISDEHTNYKWVSEQELRSTPYVGEEYKALLEKAGFNQIGDAEILKMGR